MKAAVPVLLLVALAGCQSVFSASVSVASDEDASDERVEIGDLQKSDESEAKAEIEVEKHGQDNCFEKAIRDQPEQKIEPTASSVSAVMTQEAETPSMKEEKTEDGGTEARAEVQAESFDMSLEDSDSSEERFDIQVLKHAAGDSDVAVE